MAPNLAPVLAAAERYDGRFADLVRFLLPTMARVVGGSSIGGVVKMVIGESRNFPELARVWHDALVGPAVAAVSGVIARCQAKGEVRPGDPRIFALELISPMLVALIWRETFAPIGAPAFDLEAVAQQHAETALRGMLTEPGP